MLRSDLFQLRNNGFLELLRITEQQLDFIQNDNWIDSVNELNELFDSWTRKKEELDKVHIQIEENIIQQAPDNDSEIESYNIKIEPTMERIIEIRSIVEQAIQLQFNSLSRSMKSVKDQQVILNAYYGVRRRNDIPIYFDEKK
ncbi:hypothetical protein D3C74_224440 [compost metagenome]